MNTKDDISWPSDEHFKILSEKHHKGLTDKQIALLREIGILLDKFETEQDNFPVSCGVRFHSEKPEYMWNGEVFQKIS